MPDLATLIHAGKLQEAIGFAAASLRENPTDLKARTSLFELYCFSGDWDRAQRQLNILAQGDPTQQTGALFYHHVLAAAQAREEFFESQTTRAPHLLPSPAGTVNGEPFSSVSDADSRVSFELEVIHGADYLRIPFAYLSSLTINPPKRLRDLLWIPATLTVAEGFSAPPLKDVLLPALYPGSWRHPNEAVRLGRVTVWETAPHTHAEANGQPQTEKEEQTALDDEIPFGQRFLSFDGRELPILEIRSVVFESPAL